MVTRAGVLKYQRRPHTSRHAQGTTPWMETEHPSHGREELLSSVDRAEEWGLCRGPKWIPAILCMKTVHCNKEVSLHTCMLTPIGQSAFILTPSSPPQLPHQWAGAETPTQIKTYVLVPTGDHLLMSSLTRALAIHWIGEIASINTILST